MGNSPSAAPVPASASVPNQAAVPAASLSVNSKKNSKTVVDAPVPVQNANVTKGGKRRRRTHKRKSHKHKGRRH